MSKNKTNEEVQRMVDTSLDNAGQTKTYDPGQGTPGELAKVLAKADPAIAEVVQTQYDADPARLVPYIENWRGRNAKAA